jgi:hypothetical protein
LSGWRPDAEVAAITGEIGTEHFRRHFARHGVAKSAGRHVC